MASAWRTSQKSTRRSFRGDILDDGFLRRQSAIARRRYIISLQCTGSGCARGFRGRSGERRGTYRLEAYFSGSDARVLIVALAMNTGAAREEMPLWTGCFSRK
jgi:hypothetical protein